MTSSEPSKHKFRNVVTISMVVAAIGVLCCSLFNQHRTSQPSNAVQDIDMKRVRILQWPDSAGTFSIRVPKGPPEVAQCFDSSLRLLWLRQFERAKETVDRTVEITRKSYGENSLPYAQSLRLLSFVKYNLLRNKALARSIAQKPPTGLHYTIEEQAEFARIATTMNDQYGIELKADENNKSQLFVDAREMGDFYRNLVKDSSIATGYYEQALAASNGAPAGQIDRREILYVTAMLAQCLEQVGKLEQAEDLYRNADALAEKTLGAEDPVRRTLIKERGLLAFKLKRPARCLDYLYPLISSSAQNAREADYKYVLFCALISSQVMEDRAKHKEIARAMVAFSKDTYGAASPQFKFAQAELSAAEAGHRSSLDPEVAYKNALAELTQSERLEQTQSVLQQLQKTDSH